MVDVSTGSHAFKTSGGLVTVGAWELVTVGAYEPFPVRCFSGKVEDFYRAYPNIDKARSVFLDRCNILDNAELCLDFVNIKQCRLMHLRCRGARICYSSLRSLYLGPGSFFQYSNNLDYWDAEHKVANPNLGWTVIRGYLILVEGIYSAPHVLYPPHEKGALPFARANQVMVHAAIHVRTGKPLLRAIADRSTRPEVMYRIGEIAARDMDYALLGFSGSGVHYYLSTGMSIDRVLHVARASSEKVRDFLLEHSEHFGFAKEGSDILTKGKSNV